jgi:2-polyprenyl-3-methyl-5-hydroxy-6-metoxy-1,4-benzoquinol methylase
VGSRQRNLDRKTVEGFGSEWRTFDQSRVPGDEIDSTFAAYFHVFPSTVLHQGAVGFDMGCGSGRWAARVAPQVELLHCVDASEEAVEVARQNLRDWPNCRFHVASIDATGLPGNSMDFGYCLGVLHHLPDPAAGLRACVGLLKPGAPLLVYVYYALEQRPRWYRTIWRATDLVRRVVSRLPHRAKVALTYPVALSVYLPLARAARLLEATGLDVDGLPLATYRRKSLYTMRTDALDRFGTRIEHRFTAVELKALMSAAGLERITISPEPPHWCAVGFREQVTGW